MDFLNRKNSELGEAIEQLDARYNEAGGNVSKALNSLNEDELSFVCTEVSKILASPRYYLENYHFIRRKDLQITPMWPFWDSQEMFLEIFERQFLSNQRIRIIVLKARQVGITTLGVSLIFWTTITRYFAHCLSMSDEEKRTEVNFTMARTAWDYLPWWFKPEKRYDIRPRLLGFDKLKEEERKRSPGLQSQIYFESANQPSGAAYSKSLFAVHLAEVSRYRSSDAITEGIFGSLVSLPRSIGIMESTARGRHNTWHRICKRSQERKMEWEFLFIEWFREPGYTVSVPENFERSPEEQQIAKKVKEVSKLKIRDDQLAWRREKLADFESTDGDPEKFRQEFPLTPAEAFIASGNCAFSKARLNEMLTNFVRPPLWRGEIRLDPDNKTPKLTTSSDGRFKIWGWPKASLSFYISADPSLGVEGGDPACAMVYYIPEDLTQPIYQVAEWHGHMGPTNFARVLAAMGYLFNTAEVSPECNTVTTVASDLVEVLMYPRWYRWMREDKARNMYSNWIGWQTTYRNRNELISRFREALDEWTIILRSEELIEECFDFVDEEGTEHFAARSGGYDDRVMSAMIGFYCATQFRPRLDSDSTPEEQKSKEGVDYQNTDYSPIFDERDVDPDTPDFYSL